MAVIVKTSNPSSLLSNIKKSIDSKLIETWSYDSDGDFTHTPDQWKLKGWLRPTIATGELKFGFLGNNNIITTKLIYAVYHGRFIEMLLNHFDEEITEVKSTALPTTGLDTITTAKK